MRMWQCYLRIALRARSASGLLDALGLGYDLPVGQAVYAIDAFPDDDLLWRIEWIGGVGYNTSVPSEPQIDVCLAQLPKGEKNPLSARARSCQFQKYQLTFADISGTDRDTPSSREIRAFFHFDRSAKVRKRIKISAISRSLRSFWAASISLGIKGVF